MNKVTPFSERQDALILGGLLGDSHVQKTSAATGKCRLRFSQNAKQKSYLEWKYAILRKDFCRTTKGIIADVRNRETGQYSSYAFYIGYMDEFKSIHAKWYIPKIQISKKGVIETRFVKTVPFDLNKIFTDPLALAVWYLDDGTKRSDTESCRLATQSFTKEENEILRGCLRQNFGIRSEIEDFNRDKNGQVIYQLAILSSKNGGGYEKLRNLIEPIVAVEVPSMLYKFSKTP